MIETHLSQTLPPIDTDGFMQDPALWTEQIATTIARLDGIQDLTDSHWRVIEYLRDHYLRNGTLPVMRHVCLTLHQSQNCVDELFRTPREAWRIAGLPNPGEEAKSYM